MNGPHEISSSSQSHEFESDKEPLDENHTRTNCDSESNGGDQKSSHPVEISSVIIQHLSASSNEALVCVCICMVGATYVLLGRLGLLLIGLASGVILHSSWEGMNHSDLPYSRKRGELSLNVANRLLDWPRRKSANAEHGPADSQPSLSKDMLGLPVDYSPFRPKTAAALDALTDAIIRDYVSHWYEPILPSETTFPRDCRWILASFVKSVSSHLARKRTTDTFLEFLTNSSSIMIVFLNELSTAFENVESSMTPEETVRRYLERHPESSLANVLADQQQRKKLNIIADDILSSFLDTTVYACAPLRTFCREILCGVVLESTISNLSRPECINSWIIHLFSEGESEIMNAIDAGVEGARNQGVTATKRPGDMPDAPRPTSTDSFDSNSKSSSQAYKEKFEYADKATEEAITEAKRLSALIAAQDLQQSGPTDENLSGAPVTLQEEPTLTSGVLAELESAEGSADSRILPDAAIRRATNETATEPESALPSPLQASDSSRQNLEQHLPLASLTLHRASISVDDGSESSEVLIRSKPMSNYMLQVEPTSYQRTGWMVFRTYKDFESLHETLATISRLNRIQSFADNHSLLPTWKGLTNGALAKSLEKYLQTALQHESLAECERMRRFLGKEGPVSPELRNASTRPGFFPTQTALENVGRGVLDALTNAPRGVSSGSKTVLSGMTGVFGTNSSKKPSSFATTDTPPLDETVHPRGTSRLSRSDELISAAQRSSSDGSRDSSRPTEAAPMCGSSDHSSGRDSGTSLGLETRQLENVPCSDEFTANSPNRLSTGAAAPPVEHSIPGNDITSITHEETRIAVELIFAVINELYTLSSAWNIRRTLLNAAKSYILRPGNPNLETIRDLLQNSMIDANTSDEALGVYLAKLRENALPTKSELDTWPPPPSEAEKERLRESARRVFVQRGLPQALTSVMGAAASREALEKVFDCLQVQSVARGFVFSVLLQALRAVIL